MHTKIFQHLVLLIMIFMAAFFRFDHLKEQDFLMYDEGAMVFRAEYFQTYIAAAKDFPYQFGFMDVKILWLVLIVLTRLFVFDYYFAAQYLSAFFGMGTIILTYFYVKRFMQLEAIAFLSALFLSLSSIHIYASRLALPETICGFFMLLSFFIYHQSIAGNRRLAVIAGLLSSVSFLTNFMRMALMPLYVLILEIFSRKKGANYKKDLWRYPIYLFSLGFFIAFLFFLLTLPLKLYGINVSFVKQAMFNFASHTAEKNLFSFLSYPYILLHFEGIIPIVVFLGGFFFLAKHPMMVVPFCIVLAHIIVFSFVDERPTRLLVGIMPFFSMVFAYVVYYLFQKVRLHRLQCTLGVIIFGLYLIQSVQSAENLRHFEADGKRAVHYISQKDPEAGIISTNYFSHLVFLPSKKVHIILPHYNIQTLRNFDDSYKYILIDHMKYVFNTESDKPLDWNIAPLLRSIEEKCAPIKTFNHLDKKEQTAVYLETNFDFRRTYNFLTNVNNKSGKLRIYDRKQCLTKLSKI